MDKKEFFDLLEKYKSGKCTELEQKLLFKFCDDTQLNNIASKWSLTEEEETRIRILKDIQQRISAEKEAIVQTRQFNLWKVAGTLTLLIGLGLAFLYLSDTKNVQTIPQNTITLEMDNGELKVIEEGGSARIITKEGKFVAQQNDGKLIYESADEVPTLAYNTLSVPYGKRFDIELSDGTSIFLNAGSSIKYPIQFLPGIERKVYLNGEAFLKVARDEQRPFVVNADNLDVQVLGTQFNVQAYEEDKSTEVILVEGSVRVLQSEDTSPDAGAVLTPGHRASFDRSSKEISTGTVITSIYTSWMQGELVFREMTFTNILKKLERHFNVEIENRNEILSQKRFNASFGNASLEEVLEELQDNFGVGYFRNGNKIIIDESVEQ